MVEVSAQMNSESWLFPSKFASYPTVNATYNTATSIYSATKGYNRLTEYTANLAERTAVAVAQPLYHATKPLITRIEPTLHVADKYATEQLEKLEEKAPLMTEEPGKIYQVARETTMCHINQSYVGQAVNYAIQPVLVAAEKLTPRTPTEGEEESFVEEGESNGKEKDDVTLNQTMKRAYRVGTKLQQRALDKAMENVTSLRKRSQDTLTTLTHAVDLIQYAKNIESATGVDKVRDFFEEIFEDEETVENEDLKNEASGDDMGSHVGSKDADVKRKTLVVSRNLSKKLKGGYESTITYAKPYLSDAMFSRLQHGQSLLDGIYQTFVEAKTLKDVSDTWLETTRSNLQYLSQSLRELSLETAEYIGSNPPASWLYHKRGAAETEGENEDAAGSRGSVSSSYAPSESLDEDLEIKNSSGSQDQDQDQDQDDDQDQDQDSDED